MKKKMLVLLIMPLLTACMPVSKIAENMARPANAMDAAFDRQTQDRLYLGVLDGLIKQGRYEAALAFLDQYPNASPRAQILRGNALVGAGYWREAIIAYGKIADPAYAAQAQNGIGRTESARDNWGAAIEAFRRASAIEPANAEYLNNLGYARLRLGGDGLLAAASNLKRAHDLYPDSPTIRNNLILSAHLVNDSNRMSALLFAIKDEPQRKVVNDFVLGWPKTSGQLPFSAEVVK